MSTKRSYGIEDLERKLGSMTVGLYIRAFREAEEATQTEFGRKLGLSRANLCDIEKGRKLVTPERAAKIAKRLGVPESALVQLALQDLLRASKLNYQVELKRAS